MRIIGSMVVKNEADRYLDAVLGWLRPLCDDLIVFDDRSDDDSAQIAKDHGCTVHIRNENEPSFMEDEGAFRELAWVVLEQTTQPGPGDWVLSVDADEFFVADDAEVRSALLNCVSYAENRGFSGVEFPVHEVFGFNEQRPLVRTDGFWGSITAVRFFRYDVDGRFAKRGMASGSHPSYVSRISPETCGVSILHYGYATPQDRYRKYLRYTQSNKGHNEQHIKSIIQTASLKDWTGVVPLAL